MVEGTVATIQPYGAFVNIGPDLNGLLHISQISHDRISAVEQVLEIGQKLKVCSSPTSCQCAPPINHWSPRLAEKQPSTHQNVGVCNAGIVSRMLSLCLLHTLLYCPEA